MTARPQDVALLPLPAVLWQWLSRHASEQDANDVAEAVRHYARANVTAALASAQAREEELRVALLNVLPFVEHADSCGDADAYNNATMETCGCGLDAIRAYADELLSTNAATQTGERNG